MPAGARVKVRSRARFEFEAGSGVVGRVVIMVRFGQGAPRTHSVRYVAPNSWPRVRVRVRVRARARVRVGAEG